VLLYISPKKDVPKNKFFSISFLCTFPTIFTPFVKFCNSDAQSVASVVNYALNRASNSGPVTLSFSSRSSADLCNMSILLSSTRLASP